MSAEAATKGDPLRWQRVWSIGIYAGPSPFRLALVASHPVLSAADVCDVDGYYVADPFMLQDEAGWHMYFEVLLRASRRDLIQGLYADPTIFFEGGRWWILACSKPYQNRTMNLFVAENLLGPWREHPRSPVVADDRHLARPGGRVFRWDGKLISLAQDCVPRYGTRLQAVEITSLGSGDYAERVCPVNPLLQPAAAGWNSVGMHHMDPHMLPDGSWIACVDGDTLVPAVAEQSP